MKNIKYKFPKLVETMVGDFLFHPKVEIGGSGKFEYEESEDDFVQGLFGEKQESFSLDDRFVLYGFFVSSYMTKKNSKRIAYFYFDDFKDRLDLL